MKQSQPGAKQFAGNPWNLSQREVQVLSMLFDSSATAKSIGRNLGISGNTVECTLYNARQKIGARNSRLAAMGLWRWNLEQAREAVNQALAARLAGAAP